MEWSPHRTRYQANTPDGTTKAHNVLHRIPMRPPGILKEKLKRQSSLSYYTMYSMPTPIKGNTFYDFMQQPSPQGVTMCGQRQKHTYAREL